MRQHLPTALYMETFVTEVSFQNGNQSNFNYQFDHCLLKLDNSVNLSTPEFINCIRNENPNFVDLFEHNFNIDSISPARYSGNSSALNEFILMSDKNGVLRTSPQILAHTNIINQL